MKYINESIFSSKKDKTYKGLLDYLYNNKFEIVDPTSLYNTDGFTSKRDVIIKKSDKYFLLTLGLSDTYKIYCISNDVEYLATVNDFSEIPNIIKNYFNLVDKREREKDIINSISDDYILDCFSETNDSLYNAINISRAKGNSSYISVSIKTNLEHPVKKQESAEIISIFFREYSSFLKRIDSEFNANCELEIEKTFFKIKISITKD